MTEPAEVQERSTATSAAIDYRLAQQAEQRYLTTVQTLIDDARDFGHIELLADVLAWELVRIGTAHGSVALGDIIQRFGFHLRRFAERQNAQREAEEARQAGRAPQ